MDTGDPLYVSMCQHYWVTDWTMMNFNLSHAVAHQIGALPNCCYRNAMLGILLCPQLARWQYVEGWVICRDWPIEHGWTMGPTGEVVDPTFALFGQRFLAACYFPGASFRCIDVDYYYSVAQLVEARHVTPLSYRSASALSLHEAAKTLAYASR